MNMIPVTVKTKFPHGAKYEETMLSGALNSRDAMIDAILERTRIPVGPSRTVDMHVHTVADLLSRDDESIDDVIIVDWLG